MTLAVTETARLRVLVVDDDSTFRTRLVAALAARQLDAFGSASPAEARQLCQRLRPDRVIVDLRMPGGSGLDLVTDILRMHPQARIVVLTGYGSIATALEATRRGAVDYLTKPADADQILAAFEKTAKIPAPNSAPSLARVEWEHIQRVLMDCNGNISQAARVLGIHRRSLQRKLSKYPPEP
ncbi:MAG: response regulator [Tepidisphaeraceae bacterium]|jgi:two-component system response regulator RegA